LPLIPALKELRPDVLERLAIEATYSVRLDRQNADIAAFLRDEHFELDPMIDYWQITTLSSEARDRLTQAKPPTLAAAKRLSGLTPANILSLRRYLQSTPPPSPASISAF